MLTVLQRLGSRSHPSGNHQLVQPISVPPGGRDLYQASAFGARAASTNAPFR
jgi:hypothetical protein